MEIENIQDIQVRQAILKKVCEYMIFILFILLLLCVNLWCIFSIIVSTKDQEKSLKTC